MLADNKNPSFRKVISPWHDSTPLCVVLAAVMALILGFALVGVDMALETNPPAVWIPATLAACASWVLVSLIIRLIRRHMDKGSEPL